MDCFFHFRIPLVQYCENEYNFWFSVMPNFPSLPNYLLCTNAKIWFNCFFLLGRHFGMNSCQFILCHERPERSRKTETAISASTLMNRNFFPIYQLEFFHRSFNQQNSTCNRDETKNRGCACADWFCDRLTRPQTATSWNVAPDPISSFVISARWVSCMKVPWKLFVKKLVEWNKVGCLIVGDSPFLMFLVQRSIQGNQFFR